MILDVGSGCLSWDVARDHVFFEGKNVVHFDIERNSFKVDVVGDGAWLPFRDKSFSVVLCSHVLEHVKNPLQFLGELKRVSCNVVVVKVPNESYYKSRTSSDRHIFGWSLFTFGNFLRLIFDDVQVFPSWKYRRAGRLKRLLLVVLRLFYGDNELTGVCRIK